MRHKVLLPMPTLGFDPSEVAIPWKLLSKKDIKVVFATPEGTKSSTDIRMLTGKDLGIWKSLLRARKDAVNAYNEMIVTEPFCNPIKYSEINIDDYDGILLPGGHDKPVKEFLESNILQKTVVDFFHADKKVAAICHGVLLAARSIDEDTGKSILYNVKTTCLLKSQEMAAYNMTKLWLKDYYLTYPEISVEEEVKSLLADEKNFIQGPKPLFRDDMKHLSRGYALRDGNYISARWPGDLCTFMLKFIEALEE